MRGAAGNGGSYRDPREAATTEEPAGDFADDRSPRTERLGVTRAVGALELGEVTLDGPVQRRTSRLAWPVDGCGLLVETDHGTPLLICFRYWNLLPSSI